MPSSRSATIVTTANASLISKRSTCSIVQSIFSSSRRIAATGAVVNHSGCWLQVAAPLMTAIGLSLAARQCSGDATRSAAAPSLMLDAFPAVIVPSRTECRLERSQLGLVEFRRAFVGRDASCLPSGRDLDRHDFGVEDAVGDRLPGTGVASHGEIVLLGPAEVILLGADLAAGSHVLVAVDVPEAVEDHGVEELTVAESIALAGFGEQVGRTAHALHAAGDDQRRVAGADRLVGEHDGFQARAADLVDRECTDGIGQTGEDRRLAGGILAQARPQITLPMMTSLIDFPATPVRSRRALMQAAPSSGAGTLARAPFMAPMGVRTPATMNDRSLKSSFLSIEAEWATRPT